MITIKMESKSTQRMFKRDVFGILRRFWAPQADSVQKMCQMRSQMGVVFDLYEDQYVRFMDTFDHLKAAEGDRLNFDVMKCNELPELAEDDPSSGAGSSWRNDQ